jgi:dUTP pyrophosphatase
MEETTVLTDAAIRELLRATPPLLEDVRDPETQVQSCGVDLTIRSVSMYVSAGSIDYDNSQRALSRTEPVSWTGGWAHLEPGGYHIVYNEKVNLPADVMALIYPRSSLLRCGATIHTAVWDPGYSGRGESLLVVHNPRGLRLAREARVGQLVFTRLGSDVERGYRGRFHGENV